MSTSWPPPEGDGALELAAPAKVNLYLRVLGRRVDGYHELLTVLQTVDLCDTVRVALRPRRAASTAGAPDVTLTLPSGAAPHAVPAGDENLVVRAAHALLREAGAAGDVGVDLHLHKRIPAGGGLGGGSSDAAATLLGLQHLLGAPCAAPALARLAAALGSDVPFFLHGGTALCTGRGEVVEPIAPPAPFALTLFLPPFGTPTPAVYAALQAGPARAASEAARAALRRAFGGADEQRLQALFRNDLQAAAARAMPALGALLARTGLQLSGSGSTLFTYGRASAERAPECAAMLIRSRAPGGKP